MELTSNNVQNQQTPNSNNSGQPPLPQTNSGGLGSIFGSEQKPNVENNAKVDELSTEMKSLTTRTRTLEEKFRNIRASLQMNEKNTLEENKKVNAEIKDINQEIFSLKKEFKQISSKMDIILKEIALTAKKENVESIERYLNLWNPVDFVSQKEIVHVVKRALLQLGVEIKKDVIIRDDITPYNSSESKPQPFEEEGM